MSKLNKATQWIEDYARSIVGGESSTLAEPLVTTCLDHLKHTDVLYRQEQEGYKFFRVPCLVAHEDVLLAFAEGRRDHDQDWGEMDIALRIGHIKPTEGEIEWDDIRIVARVPGKRCMNPSAVVDRFTDTIHLLFITALPNVTETDMWKSGKNQFQIYHIKSVDRGQYWTDPCDITSEVLGHRADCFSSAVVGPGHGVQMKCGRMVVPAYIYKRTHHFIQGGLYGNVGCATVIYSQGSGDNMTWCLGEIITTKHKKKSVNTCESTVFEHMSKLFVNSRVFGGDCRVLTSSEDGGESFSEGKLVPELSQPSSGCMGGSINVIMNSGDEIILFTNPGHKKSRRNLYLTVSVDSMRTWKKKLVLNNGPSAYSDVAYYESSEEGGPHREGGYIAIMYERGVNRSCEEIVVDHIRLDEIMRILNNPETFEDNDYHIVSSFDTGLEGHSEEVPESGLPPDMTLEDLEMSRKCSSSSSDEESDNLVELPIPSAT